MTSPLDLPARAARALDRADHAGFLALCTPDFDYQVIAFSPELGRDMIWFDHGRDSLTSLFQTLPEHLRRPDRLLRHLGPSLVEEQSDTRFRLDTSFAVFRTTPRGDSHLWVVGRYEDELLFTDHGWKLARRLTRLDTRDLGIGTHEPI
jgi:methanesulfonate monooxygenase small subunit